MDPVLKTVERLAAVAKQRPMPLHDSDTIMRRLDGLLPDPTDHGEGGGWLVVMTATATAAAVLVALGASLAWADLHNPFLSLETLGNIMERL